MQWWYRWQVQTLGGDTGNQKYLTYPNYNLEMTSINYEPNYMDHMKVVISYGINDGNGWSNGLTLWYGPYYMVHS